MDEGARDYLGSLMAWAWTPANIGEWVDSTKLSSDLGMCHRGHTCMPTHTSYIYIHTVIIFLVKKQLHKTSACSLQNGIQIWVMGAHEGALWGEHWIGSHWSVFSNDGGNQELAVSYLKTSYLSGYVLMWVKYLQLLSHLSSNHFVFNNFLKAVTFTLLF